MTIYQGGSSLDGAVVTVDGARSTRAVGAWIAGECGIEYQTRCRTPGATTCPGIGKYITISL
jgi:hypothetical protein